MKHVKFLLSAASLLAIAACQNNPTSNTSSTSTADGTVETQSYSVSLIVNTVVSTPGIEVNIINRVLDQNSNTVEAYGNAPGADNKIFVYSADNSRQSIQADSAEVARKTMQFDIGAELSETDHIFRNESVRDPVFCSFSFNHDLNYQGKKVGEVTKTYIRHLATSYEDRREFVDMGKETFAEFCNGLKADMKSIKDYASTHVSNMKVCGEQFASNCDISQEFSLNDDGTILVGPAAISFDHLTGKGYKSNYKDIIDQFNANFYQVQTNGILFRNPQAPIKSVRVTDFNGATVLPFDAGSTKMFIMARKGYIQNEIQTQAAVKANIIQLDVGSPVLDEQGKEVVSSYHRNESVSDPVFCSFKITHEVFYQGTMVGTTEVSYTRHLDDYNPANREEFVAMGKEAFASLCANEFEDIKKTPKNKSLSINSTTLCQGNQASVCTIEMDSSNRLAIRISE